MQVFKAIPTLSFKSTKNEKLKFIPDAPPRCGETRSTEGVSDLSTENMVSELRKPEQNIEKAFGDVSDSLNRAYTMVGKKKKRLLNIYKLRWKAHHDCYVTLAWKSRTIAGTLRTYAQDFSGDLMRTIIETPLAGRSKEIESYRKGLESNDEKGKLIELTQGFLDLRTAVTSFHKEIETFIGECQGNVKTEMTQVWVQMETVNQRLQQAEALADVLANLDNVEVEGTSKCLTALVLLCPVLLLATGIDKRIINSVGDVAAKAIHNSSVYRKLLWKKEKLDSRNAKNQQVQDELREIASSLKSDLSFIHSELKVFEATWKEISSDLEEILTTLKIALATQSDDRFRRKIDDISKKYKDVVVALKAYETKVCA